MEIYSKSKYWKFHNTCIIFKWYSTQKLNFSSLKSITLTVYTYSSCGKSFLPRPYYYPYRWNRWFLPVELPTNATAGELHRCISCNRVYCSRLTTWVEPWVIITFLHFFPRFYTVPLLAAGANFPLCGPQQRFLGRNLLSNPSI